MRQNPPFPYYSEARAGGLRAGRMASASSVVWVVLTPGIRALCPVLARHAGERIGRLADKDGDAMKKERRSKSNEQLTL